jgi:hypothetical protein
MLIGYINQLGEACRADGTKYMLNYENQARPISVCDVYGHPRLDIGESIITTGGTKSISVGSGEGHLLGYLSGPFEFYDESGKGALYSTNNRMICIRKIDLSFPSMAATSLAVYNAAMRIKKKHIALGDTEFLSLHLNEIAGWHQSFTGRRAILIRSNFGDGSYQLKWDRKKNVLLDNLFNDVSSRCSKF